MIRIRSTLAALAPFLAAAAVLTAMALFIESGKSGLEEKDYTAYGTGPNGAKALYMLTGRMGYDTGVFRKPSRFFPDGATLVCVQPDFRILGTVEEKKGLLEWVGKGNTLILSVMSSWNEDDESYVMPEEFITSDFGSRGTVSVMRVKKGLVVAMRGSENLVNQGLKNYDAAITFVEILGKYGGRQVLFDEYVHGLQQQPVTVWDILGPAGSLAAIQMLLALLALLYAVSRRFGSPHAMPGTGKAEEGAAVKALAGIYSMSGAAGAILQKHAGQFEGELSSWLGLSPEAGTADIVAAASSDIILRNFDLRGLFERCRSLGKSRSGKRDLRRLVKIVEQMEKIRKVLV